MSSCSVSGIASSVVSENKDQTETNVRRALKTNAIERAEATGSPMAVLLNALRKVKPSINGKKIHLLDIGRTEDGEFVLKYKVGSNTKVITAPVDQYLTFDTENPNFQFDKASVERLYSDAETVYNNDGFEEMALDITNDPNKIISVAEDLIRADEYHNDEDFNGVLRGQLARIVKPLVEMVPNLNIHINNAGEANFGEFNIRTNDIRISKGLGGSKSLMEIYVHELYHAVTHFALSSKDTEIRKYGARMEDIRSNFLKNTTEADLIRLSGNKLTEEQAGKLLDHLTDPKVGLHEFVALAMSNKAVMMQLRQLDVTKKDEVPQTLFHRLVDAVYKLFGRVNEKLLGEPKGDDLQRMVYLVTQLHSANKKPLEAKRVLGIKNLVSIFDGVDKRFSDYLDKKLLEDKNNIGRNAPKPGENKYKHIARVAARSFFDEQARDILGNTLSIMKYRGGYNVFRPEGTLRTIMRDMVESDATQDQIEQLGMVSLTIDQLREFTATNVERLVKNGFREPVSEEVEQSLTTSILDTDLSTIYFNYDMSDLLNSNDNIDKAIKDMEADLKSKVDERSFNFYKAQSALLADYMRTGQDNIGLLLNARNIAMKVGTSIEQLDVSEDIVTIIDELTSLKALRKVPREDKNILKDLVDNDKDAIDAIVAFQRGQKVRSEKELFPTYSDKLKMIKGYSSEITDPDIDIKFAPLAKEAELKKLGYKLSKPLTKHDMDSNDTPMGMFVNEKHFTQTFHRVGLRISEKAGRGTTVTESHAMSGSSNITLKAVNDIRAMRARQASVMEEMMSGTYDPTANENDSMVTPVLNNNGRVKDFRYQMNKQDKIDFLAMERKISTVMGRSFASIVDKAETDKYNERLMEVIDKDAAENLKEDQVSRLSMYNSKEYIRITKDSLNKDAADLWSILPDTMKNKYPEGFMVRRDLMFSALGYREMSIADIPGVRFLSEGSKDYQAVVKYSIQFAEKLWKELIKISKADIIIRTPGVFIGNIVSNVVLAYMSGHSIKDIFRLKYQGVKELNKYVQGLNESIQLQVKVESGVATKQEMRRLDEIRNNLNNSPVKDLVDEGFYTTIIEEAEIGNEHSSYFKKMAKNKLKRVPKIFSDGVDFLYITENTKLFKLMEKGIQASDFAARYAQYHLMLEQGMDKSKAVKIVRDNYINYNKPNSKFVEWANQMGFMMFTKYFTRVQRVLRDYGKTHPSKVLLAVLGQEYLLGDIDDITDQSILTKDMGNLFYNPFDNLMRVITPSTLEAVDWAINGK